MILPEKPRTIDCAATFNALAGWMRDLDAPGFIVGISGTDSILSFLIAAKALEQAGKAHRMLGIHYGAPFPPENKTQQDIEKIISFSPAYRWEARVIVPWLKTQAPQAKIQVNSDIDYTDDYQRWGDQLRQSVNNASTREPLPIGENYWVIGTRNATEVALGAYSNISNAASVMPVAHLWKSEILKLCDYLDVPSVAMAHSRQVDCDCGRFDLAADHIEEVDWVLMARSGVLSPDYLKKAIEPGLLNKLETFVDEQVRYAGFKKNIPYRPQPAAVIAGP